MYLSNQADALSRLPIGGHTTVHEDISAPASRLPTRKTPQRTRIRLSWPNRAMSWIHFLPWRMMLLNQKLPLQLRWKNSSRPKRRTPYARATHSLGLIATDYRIAGAEARTATDLSLRSSSRTPRPPGLGRHPHSHSHSLFHWALCAHSPHFPSPRPHHFRVCSAPACSIGRF